MIDAIKDMMQLALTDPKVYYMSLICTLFLAVGGGMLYLLALRARKEMKTLCTFEASPPVLSSGRIELLDMGPILQKYSELPQDISGYVVYPPIGTRSMKLNMSFTNDEDFQKRVDALPENDLIVYFDPKRLEEDMIDDAVTLYKLKRIYIPKSELQAHMETVGAAKVNNSLSS